VKIKEQCQETECLFSGRWEDDEFTFLQLEFACAIDTIVKRVENKLEVTHLSGEIL
jgi:hypothetical protein